MSKPSGEDKWRMGKIGKYLKSYPRLVQRFEWQRSGQKLRIYTDADWAGCRQTRKSTSGGVAMVGRHCLKFWSKTQQNITLSSAEAELVALVKGGCEGKGLIALMKDLGIDTYDDFEVYTDANAAIGIVQREGVGRTRHIDVNMLWVQQRHEKSRNFGMSVGIAWAIKIIISGISSRILML